MTAPVALSVNIAARVDDFALEIAFELVSGVAVLFGPSGSGKSTTLAMIAGLRRPASGRIVIADHTVLDTAQRLNVSPQDRRIGMVFQDGLLLPHRTVLDNVKLAVRPPVPRADRSEVARDWLSRVGAQNLAARRPSTLSGGQRQRVALARAMAGEPTLLLLDEPLSALDLTVRREMRSLVRRVLVSADVPAVVVTHDEEEANELGDLVIGIDRGLITSVDPVARSEKP